MRPTCAPRPRGARPTRCSSSATRKSPATSPRRSSRVARVNRWGRRNGRIAAPKNQAHGRDHGERRTWLYFPGSPVSRAERAAYAEPLTPKHPDQTEQNTTSKGETERDVQGEIRAR